MINNQQLSRLQEALFLLLFAVSLSNNHYFNTNLIAMNQLSSVRSNNNRLRQYLASINRNHNCINKSRHVTTTSKSVTNMYLSTRRMNQYSKTPISTFLQSSNNKLIVNTTTRSFSDKPPAGETNKSQTNKNNTNNHDAGDEATTNEIMLTPGQKVVAGTRLTLWAGAFVFACACAYYVGKELIPTKMSPNSIFNRAFELIQENDEIKRRFGVPLKAYGRDHGGHREGRRNFIEHTEYTDKDDGSKRVRVRFNLEGQFSHAFVFAEVSADMPSGEFVYLLVQDKRNGHVITLIDNRSALISKRLAGSKEGQEAFANLLGKRS